MAEVKDKIVTVESLATLHEYNKNTYETKEALEARITPIENGGTNSSDGAIGLANLFASGATILTEGIDYQYGDELPPAGTKGRVFFKRVIE